MLSRSRNRPWVSWSHQGSKSIYRSVHSSNRCLDQPRDNSAPAGNDGSDPNKRANLINHQSHPPSYRPPPPGSFRSPPPHFAKFPPGGHDPGRWTQAHSPSDHQSIPRPAAASQFAKPQPLNQGQPAFPSGHPYNQPSQYTGPQTFQRPWDYRNPPHFYQSPPRSAPQPPSTSYHPQPQQGFRDTNNAPGQRFQPQPPFPPHMAHPPPPHLRPGSFAPPPFLQQPTMIPPTQFNPNLQPSVPRSKKTSQFDRTLDFDFQDLDGANALDQFVGASSPPSNSNSSTFPQRPVDPRAADGSNFARRAPFSQPWSHHHASRAANYPTFSPSPNANPRRPADQNKSRAGGRGPNNNSANPRGTSGPNQFRREKGRGSLSAKQEPKLPPPPKSVLDERGEYGVKPAPLGVPESTAHSQPRRNPTPPEQSQFDYRAIPRSIAQSTVPVNLPGSTQPIQFEASALIHPHPSNEITWAHGDAQRDQIVKRAFDLVVQNPSMNNDQKKQAVTFVDFLLLSKEERMSRMNS